MEQIAKASNNKRKFAIYLTAYHQIEQIATRDKLISAHNTSIDNQEGITADVKKELKAGAASFAKEQQKKINTGEKQLKRLWKIPKIILAENMQRLPNSFIKITCL